MKSLQLQQRILSFAHRDGVVEPQSELTTLVDTLGLDIPSHVLSNSPPQFVALQIALAGGDRVEHLLDELATPGTIPEDSQPAI
ncbi:MAG: hypothetical protein K2Y39_02640 [Candidatus Obscuribacterales bacterium]|nr:hypothetical protein [Candidatus Obscuribacterales bacterium]